MAVSGDPARAAALAIVLAAGATIDPCIARGSKDIDPAWLALKDCPDEPGCPAIVLLDDRELSYKDLLTVYKVRVVRKIFTGDGAVRFADVTLPMTGQGRWLLDDFSGVAIQPDGTGLPLKRSSVTEKVLRVAGREVRTRSAAFAGVVSGALVEYSYELNTAYGRIMPVTQWDLQQEIPVLEARFRVLGRDYEVAWARTGMDRPESDQRRESGESLFTANNVPSIPDEPFGPPSEALRTRFYFYLSTFGTNGLEDLGRGVASLGKAFMEGGPVVEATSKNLISPSDTDMQRLEKIYRYVQERILTEDEASASISDRELERPKNAGDVLERGTGSEFERTMLFLSRVRQAGLQPGLLLIESRARGVLNEKAPDESQFDSFAAAVKADGRWVFFDPATRHCPFGMLSPEKEGVLDNALLIEPGGTFAKMRVPSHPASKNVLLREGAMTLGDDAVLEGKMTEHGTIEIPEGHEVEDLPAPVVEKDPPFTFTTSYSMEGRNLVLNRRLEIDTAVVAVADYPRVKAFSAKVQEADKQVVVFRKGGGS